MLLRQHLLRFTARTATTPCPELCGCGRAADGLLRRRPQQQLLQADQWSARRGMRLVPPVCMGRRSSKIATRKACLPPGPHTMHATAGVPCTTSFEPWPCPDTMVED